MVTENRQSSCQIAVPDYFKKSSFWANDALNVTALSIWGNILIFINNFNFGDCHLVNLFEQRWQGKSLWEVDWDAKAAAQLTQAVKIPFELKSKLKQKFPLNEQMMASFVLSFKEPMAISCYTTEYKAKRTV